MESAPAVDASLGGSRHSTAGSDVLARSLFLSCHVCEKGKLLRYGVMPVGDGVSEIEMCKQCYEKEKNGGIVMSKSAWKKKLNIAFGNQRNSRSPAEGLSDRGQRGLLFKHFMENKEVITAQAWEQHRITEINFSQWFSAIREDPSFPGSLEALEMLADMKKKFTEETHDLYQGCN